jgi:hypothetical protein
MVTVFKPQHDEMLSILTQNADLLLEPQLVQSLQHFCAHVSAYKIVFDQWEKGDFSRHHSVVDYPRDLSRYLEASFQRLKAAQAKLLGQ